MVQHLLKATMISLLLADAPYAQAIDLTGGKISKLCDSEDVGRDKAVIKFANDPSLTLPLPNPSCSANSTLRMSTDKKTLAPIQIDCSRWEERRGGRAYVYRDPEGTRGGIEKIVLSSSGTSGKLILRLKGANYGADPLAGPIIYLEVMLTIDGQSYCGRFEDPPSVARRNDARKVIFKGPSVGCGKLVFLSSQTYQPGASEPGRFNSLSEADAICQALAEAASPPLRSGGISAVQGVVVRLIGFPGRWGAVFALFGPVLAPKWDQNRRRFRRFGKRNTRSSY